LGLLGLCLARIQQTKKQDRRKQMSTDLLAEIEALARRIVAIDLSQKIIVKDTGEDNE
jgi:hypothetical protein